jgi:hypothetical protein
VGFGAARTVERFAATIVRGAIGMKSGADLAVAAGVTREEHRAMLEYMNDMESVTRPTKSRDACAVSAEQLKFSLP